MYKELKKRILTSIFLLSLAILTIILNEIIFAFSIFIVFIICFQEWSDINVPYFFIKRKKKGFVQIKILGLIYLFIFFLSSLILYTNISAVFFLFVLFVCSSSDIGGYFFGKLIGGKKLTKISPNKTISGSIGSFIFSTFPLFFFNYLNLIDLSFSLKNLLFCIIISLFSQTGDLLISHFKRLNKVKDTGSILPGHGGLLDRVDGMIFAIPGVYILKVTQIF